MEALLATRLKSWIKRVLFSMGYEVRQVSKTVGHDPLYDLQRLAGVDSPVIIDAGANVGQSVLDFYQVFRRPVIHSFEPARETFIELQHRTSGLPGLRLNNCALGSSSGVMQLNCNSVSEMSSFLEQGAGSLGSIQARYDVGVKTLDEYCSEEGVTNIDILKSDTQGFDLEVIKGAKRLLNRKAIHLIYVEINLWGVYNGAARLDEIYSLLSECGFSVVSFYRLHYIHPNAAWTDALFINKEYACNVQ